MLNILSYNVKGIGGLHNENKRNQLFDLYFNSLKKKVDIIFLQETHVDITVYNQIKKEWKTDNKHFWSIDETSKGVAILIMQDNIEVKQVIEVNQRSIKLKIKINNIEILLINSYIPAKRDERLNFLREYEIESEENIIWGGDFNFVENKEDCSSGKSLHGKKELDRIIEANGMEMKDAHVYLNHIKEHTFKHVNDKYTARLDRFYISKPLSPKIISITRESAVYQINKAKELKPMSDHYPIRLTLKLKEVEIGRGYWKLNTSILNMKETQIEIYKIVKESDIIIDPIERFEFIKKESIQIFKKVSKKKTLTANKIEKQLNDKLNNLNKVDPNNLIEIQKIEEQLKLIRLPAELWKMQLLKIEQNSFDEIPSKYLTNRLKAKQADMSIERLINSDGNEIENLDLILEQSRKFYEELYNLEDSSKTARKRFLKNIHKKVSKKDNKKLLRPFTISEVKGYLKTTKRNSSPGEDGLPYEFFQSFSDILAPHITQAFNLIMMNPNYLPQQWKNGIIKLLYKKGDRRELGNWRPITLLTTTYKILTGLIQKRMNLIIPKLIHANQKGFVQNRYILDNVLTVKLIREINEEGYIVFLDGEKAFDRVNHNLILETFKKLKFDYRFILIIKSIIGGSSRIFIRNSFSNELQISNGVRQGDTLSPTLFILVIESLAENIRRDKNCKGLNISKNHMIKILLYADDISLFPKGKLSLFYMNKQVDLYNIANNGKTNKNKSIIIPININEKTEEIDGIQFIKENQMEKYLGYEFYRDKNKNGIENAIRKFETLLKKWKNLHLSIYGRANVLRTYAKPILYYPMYIDILKEIEEKRINNLIKWFLFSNDSEYNEIKKYKWKINENNIISSIENGGLNLIPIKVIAKVQKIMWTLRVIQRTSIDGWVYKFWEVLKNLQSQDAEIHPLMQYSIKKKEILEKCPKVLIPIFENWFQIPKKFKIDDTGYVGSWSNNDLIINVYEIITKKENILTLKKLNNKEGALYETNEIKQKFDHELIPIKVIIRNGNKEFINSIKTKNINKTMQFLNDISITEANSKQLIDVLLPKRERKLTPKQSEWDNEFGNILQNYKIIKNSKVRTRIKSHSFLKNSNALPREKLYGCPICKTEETSNHITFDCDMIKSNTKLIVNSYNKIFKKNIIYSKEKLITLEKEETLNVFQMVNSYLNWKIRCETKFKLIKHFENFYKKNFNFEIENYILKEFLESCNNETKLESFLMNWKNLIESYSLTKQKITMKKVFEY